MSFGDGDLHERVEELEGDLAIAERTASLWRGRALEWAAMIRKLEGENSELRLLVESAWGVRQLARSVR